jgi:bacteriorhodopsin
MHLFTYKRKDDAAGAVKQIGEDKKSAYLWAALGVLELVCVVGLIVPSVFKRPTSALTC